VVASVIVTTALAACAAYLVGSIPTGPLLASARGIDLRAVGSGNIGATNVARALGKKLGVVVLVGDALKGFLPVLLARVALGLPAPAVAVIGFAAFVGHLFPIYLGLRGGKGVATAAGIFLAMAPLATALALAVWVALFLPWRIVSIASLGAVLVFPVALWLTRAPSAFAVCALLVLVLIVWKHRGNLARIWKRAEQKL